MNHVIAILLLLALSTSPLFAQLPKISWGPEYKTNGGENLILGSDTNTFIPLMAIEQHLALPNLT